MAHQPGKIPGRCSASTYIPIHGCWFSDGIGVEVKALGTWNPSLIPMILKARTLLPVRSDMEGILHCETQGLRSQQVHHGTNIFLTAAGSRPAFSQVSVPFCFRAHWPLTLRPYGQCSPPPSVLSFDSKGLAFDPIRYIPHLFPYKLPSFGPPTNFKSKNPIFRLSFWPNGLNDAHHMQIRSFVSEIPDPTKQLVFQGCNTAYKLLSTHILQIRVSQ